MSVAVTAPPRPYKGLGFRDIEAEVKDAKYAITECPVEPAKKA